jgi:ABC-type nitrate/sulfonate/bicarbonate transport system permease component
MSQFFSAPKFRAPLPKSTGTAGLKVLLTFALGVALWELAAWATGGIGFAHSCETLGALVVLSTDLEFWRAVAETIGIALLGLSLGLFLALISGALIGSSAVIDRSTRPTLNFARSIPSVILLPLFMASVGSFGWMVVNLVATVVSFKLVVFVIRGMRDADRNVSETGQILRFTWLERLFFIALPAASVILMTGLRLSANRAYATVVLAGVIAGTPGIGYQISLARLSADSEIMLAFAFTAGLIGVVFFYGFSEIERRAIQWRPV